MIIGLRIMTWSRASQIRVWSFINSSWLTIKVNVDICIYQTRCVYKLLIFNRSLRLLPDSVRLSTLYIHQFTPVAARLNVFINSWYSSVHSGINSWYSYVHSGCCQSRCVYQLLIFICSLRLLPDPVRLSALDIHPFTLVAAAWYKRVYSIWYKNECTSSSVSDVDFYVITRKWLYYILNLLPVFIGRWEFQKYLHSPIFLQVDYTRYDVPWFVEQMSSICLQSVHKDLYIILL
jgi:hypothetical protein